MAWTQFPAHAYGGLVLDRAADEVGLSGAIDLLNVTLDKRGAVRGRSGFVAHGSAAANAWRSIALHRMSATRVDVLAHQGTTLSAFADMGLPPVAATATATVSSNAPVRYAQLGTPTAMTTYIADSTNTLKKWNGTTLSSPTATVDGVAAQAMPLGNELVVQPSDNRLVVAGTATAGGPDAVASSGSHVWFSDAGNAESWTTTNFVQLTPGDGYDIVGAVAYNNMVFVFKPNRLFVFYGNSTDSTGNPVFNYRTVELPHQVPALRGGSAALMGPRVCATSEGVYFQTHHGIYRTTGGQPQLVSGVLEPFSSGSNPSTWQGGTILWRNPAALAWHRNRLHVMFEFRLLEFDPTADWWTVWDLPANALVSNAEDGREAFFTRSSGGNNICQLDSTTTTDAGTSITSRYRTGFYDLGYNGEKRVRKGQLWGTGTVAYSLSSNFGSLGTATNVTLGTSPAIARGQGDIQDDGTLFSHQFASVSGGAWAVHRFHQEMQPPRPSGTKTT